MTRRLQPFVVRFIAARSAYSWVAAVTWSLAICFVFIQATGPKALGQSWLTIGAIGSVLFLSIVLLIARSGVAILDNGTVVVVDGYRTYKYSSTDIDSFIIVDSVSLIAAPLLMLGTGPFAPDRLGVLLRNGKTVKLNWCFANHDDIRVIRKRLNSVLTAGTAS